MTGVLQVPENLLPRARYKGSTAPAAMGLTSAPGHALPSPLPATPPDCPQERARAPAGKYQDGPDFRSG